MSWLDLKGVDSIPVISSRIFLRRDMIFYNVGKTLEIKEHSQIYLHLHLHLFKVLAELETQNL